MFININSAQQWYGLQYFEWKNGYIAISMGVTKTQLMPGAYKTYSYDI